MLVSRMRKHPDAIVIPFEYDHSYRGWRTFFKSHEPTLSRVIGLKGIELDYGLEILSGLLTEVKHEDTIEHVIGKNCYRQTRIHSLEDYVDFVNNPLSLVSIFREMDLHIPGMLETTFTGRYSWFAKRYS